MTEAVKKKAVKAKGGIGFTPYAGMVALAAPMGIYPPANLVLTKEMYLKQVAEKAKDYTTGEIVVAGTGTGVDFVVPGDVISLQSHVRVQTLEIDGEVVDKPTIFWLVRESEILVKHDKKKK